MLFHTYDFLIFFLIVFLVFLPLRKTRYYNYWLLAASYFFYGSWNWWYLTLIVYSTFLDYFCVNMMDDEYVYPKKIRWRLGFAYLAVGAILEVFSYFFFTQEVKALFRKIGDPLAESLGFAAGPAGAWVIVAIGLLVFFAFTCLCHKLFPPIYRKFISATKFNEKKVWLWVSIINNLGLLAFFKYANFFADNINSLMAAFGSTYTMPGPEVLFTGSWKFMLPVGISFFTFQSMSYTIDFYRGNIKREPSFIRFASFVSLFPQLVAGPIERAKNLLDQLTGTPRITGRHISDGLSMFMVGLFKKLALADFLAMYADKIYAQPDQFTSGDLVLATFAFGWQIYFDFSGYTDMARGVARMMGFNLMLNFNNPYLATGLGDFWGRWHISLSTWFRDYVYIPLGGSRGGKFITYKNMFLTMVISGFWHGAAWTFIIWGALHAVGRMLTRELELTKFYQEKVPRLLKQLVIFVFAMYTWVWFRADSFKMMTDNGLEEISPFESGWLITKRIFTTEWGSPSCPVLMLILCFAVWGYQFAFESRLRSLLSNGVVKTFMVIAMLFWLLVFASTGGVQFIYFQF